MAMKHSTVGMIAREMGWAVRPSGPTGRLAELQVNSHSLSVQYGRSMSGNVRNVWLVNGGKRVRKVESVPQGVEALSWEYTHRQCRAADGTRPAFRAALTYRWDGQTFNPTVEAQGPGDGQPLCLSPVNVPQDSPLFSLMVEMSKSGDMQGFVKANPIRDALLDFWGAACPV